MEANHFDTLAKTLVTHPTRRAVLRLLAGGGLAGLLAVGGWEEAAARRIKPGHRCEKKGKKLGKCVKGAFCNKDGYCKCRGCLHEGRCVPSCGGVCCDAGHSCCLDPNGNTQSCRLDDLTCGACRHSCGGRCCGLNEQCSNGKCCPGGWFGCKGNAPACCPNGTKCCPGINYCCDAKLGCSCPNDNQVCEQPCA